MSMPPDTESIPFLSCLGLSITTRCPIACAHCIVEAGPRRTEEMDPDEAAGWLLQAAAYRGGHIRSVVITGGEPFLNLPLLQRILQSAAAAGLVPAVVTNAFWATDPAAAARALDALPQIRMLTVSADPYHQKSIPFANVARAIAAVRARGLACNIAACVYRENDPDYLDLRRQLEALVDPALIRIAPIFPAGRARRAFGRDAADWSPDPSPHACCAADYPTIHPGGSVIGCMGIVKQLPEGHPLNYGNLRRQSLAAILDAAETNAPLHALRLWGPSRLADWLAAAGCGGRLPQRYWKNGCCDLCYHLDAHPELCQPLAEFAARPEQAQLIAQGRAYYFRENAMPDKLDAPFFANLGFFITYRCQVACPHCVVNAGPHRTEEMDLDECCAWIAQAARGAAGRVKAVCLTGGEPFIDLERLDRICLAAIGAGMVPTAVTNAFWATTPAAALETLRAVPALRVISVSTDAHHLKQIPFERVANALTAARALGLHSSVSVCAEDPQASAHLELLERLEEFVPRSEISTVLTYPTGRGAGLVHIGLTETVAEPPATACDGAHTPVVFPNGRVLACIGPIVDIPGAHPLELGDLRRQSFAEVLAAAERNAALHVIRVWGPGRLHQLLDDRGHGDLLPRRFVKDSMCGLCHALLADPRLRAPLAALSADEDLQAALAQARQFHFGETASA